MESSSKNIIAIIYDKRNAPEMRLAEAQDALNNKNLTPDFILKWISNNIAFDTNFQTNEDAWKLFHQSLTETNIESDKFSLTMKPNIAILNAFRSNIRDIALETLKLLQIKYPNSWRPKFDDLILTFSQLLQDNEIYEPQISFLITLISSHRELTVGSELVFKKVVDIFDPLIDNISKLNEQQVLQFISRALCGPFLFQKISGKDLGSSFDTFLKKLTTPSESDPIRPGVISFIHVFMPIYKESAIAFKITNLFQFPLNLYKRTQSLDLAVPVFDECAKLQLYTPQSGTESDFQQLNLITDEAIKNNHYSVLASLARLDFRLVRPSLTVLLEKSDENFALSALEMAFSLRMPQVIFGYNDFPDDFNNEQETRLDSHICEFPIFVTKYSELVSHLNSSQTNGLLKILAMSQKESDNCLLFWTVKNARFTPEHVDVVNFIVKTAGKSPWRCAAASIAGKALRFKTATIASKDMLEEHPISLFCYLMQNHELFESEKLEVPNCLPQKHGKITEFVYENTVSLVPTPNMADKDYYRLLFIIQNLYELAVCFEESDLLKILRFVVKASLFCQNLQQPKTIADYCMRLFSNSYFYENSVLKKIFHLAAHELLSSKTHQTKIFTAMLISSMPNEFVSVVQTDDEQNIDFSIAVESFEVLVEYAENGLDGFENTLFEEISKDVCKMISQLVISFPYDFVKENIKTIIDRIPLKIHKTAIPTLLYTLGEIPSDLDFNSLQKETIIGICNYCFQNGIKTPFEAVLFENDIECVCEQTKSQSPHAATYILNKVTYNKTNIKMILEALCYVQNLSELTKNFEKKLDRIFEICYKDDNDPGAENVTNLVRALPRKEIEEFMVTDPDLIIRILEKSPFKGKIAILSGVYCNKKVYKDYYKKYIKEIVNNSNDLETIKALINTRVARFYNLKIIESIFFDILTLSKSTKNINDVCNLMSAVTDLFTNARKCARVHVVSNECVRKLMSLFFKYLSNTNPTYKHLKTFSKFMATSARIIRPDFQHYIISTFVSLISNISMENTKQKMMQNSIYPVFQRVGMDQLSEVSIGLHETHRQQFQILFKRWQEESQYTGKV